jgi:hypothetical protein
MICDDSEESDAAEEVAAARVDRSIGRALCQIAVLEASAVSYCTRKGRWCERRGVTTADAHASQLLGGSPSATLDLVGVFMYNNIVGK